MVRLGQDVDRTGRLADEALARAFAAIDEYAALIARARASSGSGSARPRPPATPPTPPSSPPGCATRLGRRARGASPATRRPRCPSTVRSATCATPPAEPVLVVDIGGGSTELILGGAPGAPRRRATRMDIGSVRLHERHLHSDPPTAAEVAACVADIDAHLDACPVDPAAAATVVGVAGTITHGRRPVCSTCRRTTAAAIDQARARRSARCTRYVDRLLAMTVAERRALPYMHPGRADVIGAGALILDRVLRRTGVDHAGRLRGRHPRRDRLVARRAR